MASPQTTERREMREHIARLTAEIAAVSAAKDAKIESLRRTIARLRKKSK